MLRGRPSPLCVSSSVKNSSSTRTIRNLLNRINFFQKLSPHDRHISINVEKFVLDKDMLVRDLSRHNRYLHEVVDVEPDPNSFSLTVMMDTHTRLGGDSFFFRMSEDFLRMVYTMVEKKEKGSDHSDDMWSVVCVFIKHNDTRSQNDGEKLVIVKVSENQVFYFLPWNTNLLGGGVVRVEPVVRVFLGLISCVCVGYRENPCVKFFFG